METTTTTTAPVLLFVHGSNFCKEIWKPIQRYIKELPLLQTLSDVEFVSIDLPYHGSKRDNSVSAVIDEEAITVDHPASQFITLNTDTIQREVQRLHEAFGKRSIVGVGHSAGATSLWNVEMLNPGTFAGLVLFEPFVENPEHRDPKTERYLFSFALKRQHRWASREAATKHFENVKAFATWDRECLAAWIEGGIVRENDESEAVVLALHPTIEAAIYCGERIWFSDSELLGVACPVTFHSSDDTWLFNHTYFTRLEQRWPHIYTNHPKMKSTTHNLIMEKPEACAKAIHTDLRKLNCFKVANARL
ncbi:unnamed protein product [Phytophthora lilii]|uniref:Unnamed protein product n=1 Tax=Phytophthora lilii TaxID=2077276 RepID=A0A9W6YJX8_9STRA|nr:unnamed protein product [Phytophthora lilii]